MLSFEPLADTKLKLHSAPIMNRFAAVILSIQAVHVYQLKILCAKVFLSHFTLKRLIPSSQGVNMPGGSTCLIWPSFCLVTCLQLESNQNPFTHQANALTVLVYSMKGYLLLPYLCLNIISEYCTFVAF